MNDSLTKILLQGFCYKAHCMPNHLATATSPYLLQHQDNPVDWYPWCNEALARAKQESKPIFLSIGYSACHWCHVMEHESFEDAEIAALLNEHFISIKVDREERPDLDHVYMAAVQMMTGRGGWPLSVFLTPELKPFYGGTYWPAHSRHGLPGFKEVLQAVVDAWRDRRAQADEMATQLSDQLAQIEHPARSEQPLPDSERWHAVIAGFSSEFDRQHGGFGGAPKFPQPMLIDALLRDYCRTGDDASLGMATTTLKKMYYGGIYDHLGGGFARYSVDAKWLVPHFEKMLYDNALLAGVYTRAWLVTRDGDMRTAATETIDYVLRDMRVDGGAFAASEDADSEGEEGKFYVWSWEELRSLLGDEIDDFATAYGLSESGNWEGKNILHLPKSIVELAEQWDHDVTDVRRWLAEQRQKLLAVREKRVRPARDDKVILSWNAMMIDSLAESGRVLEEPRYLAAAVEAAEFLRDNLVDGEGRLRHSWRQGRCGVAAFADDYATLINATMTLYQSTGDASWLEWAHRLAQQLENLFLDREQGGFFLTGADQPEVWVRPKPVTDSSVPSANNGAATALARLGTVLGDSHWTDLARDAVRSALIYLERAPLAAGQALVALDWLIGPAWTAVFSQPFDSAAWAELKPKWQPAWYPRVAMVWGESDQERPASLLLAPMLKGRTEPGSGMSDSGAAATAEPMLHVCCEGLCREPLVGRSAILGWLEKAACRCGKTGVAAAE